MSPDQQKLFPGTHFIATILETAETKRSMSRSIAQVYIMRAAMAGILVGVFYLAYYSAVAAFTEVDASLGSVGRLVGSVIFGFALVFIYYTKSELLTSNMMITTIAVYYKKLTVRSSAWVLALCFVGNFLGGLLMAALIAFSSLLDGKAGDLIAHTVDTKLAYVTTDAAALGDLFVRAILCNFLINISMLLLYNGLVKTDGVKVVAMNVAVMLFAFLGFEHSVANTVLFTIQGLHTGIDVAAAAANVGVVLVGNFVGGGFLIGWYYAYLNDAKHRLREPEETVGSSEIKKPN